MCGNCGRRRAAVLADGDVVPCVLGRALVAGNVLRQSLPDIFTGPKWQEIMALVPPKSHGASMCHPDDIDCVPSRSDGGDCAPSEHEACLPDYPDDENGG